MIFGIIKRFCWAKKIDVERPFHTTCSFVTLLLSLWNFAECFLRKFDFFNQRDEIRQIRPKSIREGAASSGLYFRTTFAHFYFTKTFQKSRKLLLGNFQYIFSEVLLISSSFILIFSKNWENLHICFKFHETMSVRNLETQQVTYSRSTDFTGMWVRLQLWHSF